MSSLDLHHLLYKNWYDVTTKDLIWLCRDCHTVAHRLIDSGEIRVHGKDRDQICGATLHRVRKHRNQTEVNFNTDREMRRIEQGKASGGLTGMEIYLKSIKPGDPF